MIDQWKSARSYHLGVESDLSGMQNIFSLRQASGPRKKEIIVQKVHQPKINLTCLSPTKTEQPLGAFMATASQIHFAKSAEDPGTKFSMTGRLKLGAQQTIEATRKKVAVLHLHVDWGIKRN